MFGVRINVNARPPPGNPPSVPLHLQLFWRFCHEIESSNFHAGMSRETFNNYITATLDDLDAIGDQVSRKTSGVPGGVLPAIEQLACTIRYIRTVAEDLGSIATRQQRQNPARDMVVLKGGIEPTHPTMVSILHPVSNILRREAFYPVSGVKRDGRDGN
jgi:hypothetical protein